MRCGLLTALILNIILGMFMAYCIHILVKSAQTMYGRLQRPQLSYPDLAEAAIATSPFRKLRKWHKCFRYSMDFAIGFDLFGSCCVYSVIMARSISQLIEGGGILTPYNNFSIRVYILMLLIPCILICMIRSLKYLAPFSIVANLFLFTVAAATVYYGIKSATCSPMDMPAIKNIGGVLEFLTICAFSMEGFGAVLPIENHMAEPRKFYLVLIGGMTIVTFIVATIGFFGYWGFGESAMSPVTLNFPWETFSIILKVFMVLIMYVTFALNFWYPFNLVWVYLKNHHAATSHYIWERVYRAAIIVGIFCVALMFPNVSSFMGLLGAFCVSNMAFIFPAIIQLNVQWSDPGPGFMKWRLVRFILIMIFGITLCILGTVLNARNLFRSV